MMVFSMVIFASVGIVAPHSGLKAFELVFVRCVGGFFVLGGAWVLSGRVFTESWSRQELVRVFFCGIALVANWICLFRAFELMPLTLAVVLYYLAPAFVMLGSIFFKEKLNSYAVLSIVFCFIGSSLVAGINHFGFSEFLSSGVLWAVGAAIFYATLTLIGKGVKNLSPYAVACLQTLIGSLLLIAFVNFQAFEHLALNNWFWVLIIGGIHTGLVYFLFFSAVRDLPAKSISLLAYIDPFFAIFLDMSINGFRPDKIQWLGLLFMLLGLCLPLFKKYRWKNHHVSHINHSPP